MIISNFVVVVLQCFALRLKTLITINLTLIYH